MGTSVMGSFGLLASCLLVLCVHHGCAAETRNGVRRQCPNGYTFVGGMCFVLEQQRFTWPEAVAVCRGLRGHLAVLDTERKTQRAKTFLSRTHGENRVWIGLHDLIREDHFQWIHTNKPTTFTNWLAGEPNNRKKEHCVELIREVDWQWNDMPCGSKHAVLCQAWPSSAQ